MVACFRDEDGQLRRALAVAEVLICVECTATTADGYGWRAYLTVGDEDAEDVEEVAVYCPDCGAREFETL